MSKSASSKEIGRTIVAALVYDESLPSDLATLRRIVAALMVSVRDGLADPNWEVAVTVEKVAEKPAPMTFGVTTVSFTSKETLELCISTVEASKRPSRRSNPPPGIHLMLGIGSREFCQAHSHLWATSRRPLGAATWGLHLIRRLSTAHTGDVFWIDSDEDKFMMDRIDEMLQYLSDSVQRLENVS